MFMVACIPVWYTGIRCSSNRLIEGGVGGNQEAPGSKRDSSPEFGERGNERFRGHAECGSLQLARLSESIFLTSSDGMLYHVGLILTKIALPEALYPEANPRYEQ